MTVEVNFDGLVGPTHNYSGLAYGNLAATTNAALVSHPKRAALQGLDKMRTLARLGVPQGVLPPQERPSVTTLRKLGFSGTDDHVLAGAANASPRLLQAMSSAAAMWVANAATISPSPDTADGRVHFTPANLASQLHRSIETDTTAKILKATFPSDSRFVHHAPVPPALGDEGAANHTRFAPSYAEPGTHLFVFGRSAFEGASPGTYPARQSLEASQAVARQHGLNPAHVVFAQQNPAVIDQGVFHNDVISVGNLGIFLFHEDAFVDPGRLVDQLHETQPDLRIVKVPRSAVAVGEAVSSYLFNSQIVMAGDRTLLIAPEDVKTTPNVANYLETTDAFDEVITFDLRESMRNGGGPACLRLRVVLTEAELAATNTGSVWSEALDAALVTWVQRHYREDLVPADLASPELLEETRACLDELTQIMSLGPMYEFQQ